MELHKDHIELRIIYMYFHNKRHFKEFKDLTQQLIKHNGAHTVLNHSHKSDLYYYLPGM